MARRDEEENLFSAEHALTRPETYLPPFPNAESIRTALPGVLGECVQQGKAHFLSWVDFTLEHPDEIRETESTEDLTFYHYYSFFETRGKTPAFVVEVSSFDDVAQVNGFSLLLKEDALKKLLSANLVYCRATEWGREQLVRSLNEDALQKYEEDQLDEARELIDKAIRQSGIQRRVPVQQPRSHLMEDG